MSNFSCPVVAGRILNRFSKDIGHMDDLLPLTYLDFIQVTQLWCQVLRPQTEVPHFAGARPWGAQGGPRSPATCRDLGEKGRACPGKVWRWVGGWVNMSNAPCVGAATQRCQNQFKAATCWVGGAPSASQVSGAEFTWLRAHFIM